MRRLLTMKGLCGAGGVTLAMALVTASASALSLGTTTTTNAAKPSTQAGKPTTGQQYLLCGTTSAPAATPAGSSSIDHFNFTAKGNEYTESNGSTDNCTNHYNIGMFGSSPDMFTWHVLHGNVNTSSERGTEHGIDMMSSNNMIPTGVNGHVTDYDFASSGDSCGDSRTDYYASGHSYDTSCPEPSGPGNINTHGGASGGNHFRGTYGTLLYQDSNMNSPCQPGSMTYCFEAILKGQTN